MQNTASGIKQIGLIQILIANRKLSQNSFLIIDEPEVNLHPEWQFKLAKILVLISKKLNIYIACGLFGGIFRSKDGVHWQTYEIESQTNLFFVTYAEDIGMFVVVGATGTILTSIDGIHWLDKSIDTAELALDRIVVTVAVIIDNEASDKGRLLFDHQTV